MQVGIGSKIGCLGLDCYEHVQWHELTLTLSLLNPVCCFLSETYPDDLLVEQSYRVNDLEVTMGLKQSPSGQNYTTIGSSGTRSSGSGQTVGGSMVQRDPGSVPSSAWR